jgi:hypothetical protein
LTGETKLNLVQLGYRVALYEGISSHKLEQPCKFVMKSRVKDITSARMSGGGIINNIAAGVLEVRELFLCSGLTLPIDISSN